MMSSLLEQHYCSSTTVVLKENHKHDGKILHSQSLFINSFNYVLAIGSNHTILDKSLLGVNNTLILYKLS